MLYELYDIKEGKWKFGGERREMTEEETSTRNADLERRKSDFRWMVKDIFPNFGNPQLGI